MNQTVGTGSREKMRGSAYDVSKALQIGNTCSKVMIVSFFVISQHIHVATAALHSITVCCVRN